MVTSKEMIDERLTKKVIKWISTEKRKKESSKNDRLWAYEKSINARGFCDEDA